MGGSKFLNFIKNAFEAAPPPPPKHTVKAFRGNGGLAVFILNPCSQLEGGEGPAPRPGRFSFGGRGPPPQCSLYRKPGGPQGRSGSFKSHMAVYNS